MSDPVALPSRRFDRSLLSASPLAGRLEAVYAHAAVVRLDRDGALLTLLHPSRELVPFGVEIPWEQADLVTGSAVFLTRRELALGAAQRVQLVGDGTALVLERACFSHETLRAQVPIARPFAKRERTPQERRGLDKADESLRRIVLALAGGACSPSDLGAAVCRVIGAGFGSSPTGDDWLVGVAAVGHRLSHTGYTFRPAWTAFLEALDAVGAEETTPVAREMLRHAARGEFPEPLLRLATLLGRPGASDHDLREACRKLLAMGSGTGGDLLTGALSLAQGVRTQNGGIA
jgi:hypothetical protein